MGGEPVEYSALPYISVEYSTLHVLNNTNNNSNTNAVSNNTNNNSDANADFDNHNSNPNVNAVSNNKNNNSNANVVSNNINNNSDANADLDNYNRNSKANADLNNHYHNSQANADLPNLSNPYATWCHTGGLLRYDASVGSSMLIPLTHGAGAKEGSVATPRSDPTPNKWELQSNTLPQPNNTYPNNREPLLNTLNNTLNPKKTLNPN